MIRLQIMHEHSAFFSVKTVKMWPLKAVSYTNPYSDGAEYL